ncbi:SNARE protein, putative [Bodo saltans]|uniref:SNARE protein, putative n=1 Tax=Bodo saltans TaxID=75058 RepID=A0A0S4JD94_BODSA|nr:SNARE protein, putative [Bodo saltans]|eukprot:CUG86923.1 SNARE protein, putative [Bodo saltans]
MLTASHTVERATHGKIPAKWIALALGLFLTAFFLTGTHRTLIALLSIISKRGVTLFSPAGIQGFCTDLQQLASTNILQVLTLAASLYITLQTFCIPGTIALNAAIGALIGTTLGVPLAVILGTIGACCCYLLSTIFGAKLADAVDLRLMKGKGVPKLRAAVQRYRSDLLVYILFLRLTPVLPNWLVNLASPVVGVPLKTFALATFIGIIPQSYFSVRFGSAVVAAAQQRYATATSAAAGSSSGAGGHSGAPAAEALPAIVTRADQIFLFLVAVLIVVVARLKKRFSGAAATPSHNAVE